MRKSLSRSFRRRSRMPTAASDTNDQAEVALINDQAEIAVDDDVFSAPEVTEEGKVANVIHQKHNAKFDSSEESLKKSMNRSPKGNTWSAIPVALCMVVNWSEKQGSGPKGSELL